MSQDSRVFFRIFLGIGLVLILISVVVFYNQFTYSKDAIHTEGVIVDTVWHSSHSEKAEINNPWVNFFKWGFIGIMGVIFIAVGLLISMPSSKKSRRKRKSRP